MQIVRIIFQEMASKEKEIIDLKHQREVLNDKLDAINVTIANNEIQSKYVHYVLLSSTAQLAIVTKGLNFRRLVIIRRC